MKPAPMTLLAARSLHVTLAIGALAMALAGAPAPALASQVDAAPVDPAPVDAGPVDAGLVDAVLVDAVLVDAAPIDGESREVEYLLIDVDTGRTIGGTWTYPDRPLPLGSLIKPFIAMAYADGHALTYPTFTCAGQRDGCWLPAGHGRLGIVDAVAQSCNAYFLQLAQQIPPEAVAATLSWFGITARAFPMTPPTMVGLGDRMPLSPVAMARGYVQLVSRAPQPGVVPILEGLRASARTGTGRGVGEALGRVDVFVKTGTAPCVHPRRASGDGYTMAIFPADRPRLALLLRAHGRTGAESARLAGAILHERTAIR